MPTCYTCKQEIAFDKEIRSVTGKQIPLWPDKKDTHGHDETGKPIRQPIPLQPLQQQQQSPQQQQHNLSSSASQVKQQIPQQSQGGSYLDTKRIRVMLEDLTKEVRDLKESIENKVILFSNIYEGRMNAMFNAFSDSLGTIGIPASELLKQKQQRQSIIESTSPFIDLDHSKKADEFERMKEFTKTDDKHDENSAKMETED